MVIFVITGSGNDSGNTLSDNGRNGGSGNTHLRESQKTEDHDRVQDNVCNRTTYKLLKLGKIKAMRIGRVWKIPKRAVQEYIVQEAHMKATGW